MLAIAAAFFVGLVNFSPVAAPTAAELGSSMQRYDVVWHGEARYGGTRVFSTATRPVISVYPVDRVLGPSMAGPFCGWVASVADRYPAVRTFIVGNEPRIGEEKAYASVLAVCSPMLHARGLRVVGPGLHPMPGWLAQKMLNAIAARGRGLLDAFDFHPYWYSGFGLDREMVKRVRATLGPRVETWITEDGINTNWWFYSTNEAEQARQVSAKMIAARCSGVRVWLNFLSRDDGDPAGWKSGLERANGTRKPAFTAFARTARSSWCPPHDQPTPPAPARQKSGVSWAVTHDPNYRGWM